MTSRTKGKLWVVFGAGGQRDQGKRALMGAAAANADEVVVTADNPRGEPPSKIAKDITRGIPRGKSVTVTLDRAAAISESIASMAPGDVVLICGKGHETEQLLGERSVPFDDREVARRAWAARG